MQDIFVPGHIESLTGETRLLNGY